MAGTGWPFTITNNWGCQVSGFDPKSPGCGLWALGSRYVALQFVGYRENCSSAALYDKKHTWQFRRAFWGAKMIKNPNFSQAPSCTPLGKLRVLLKPTSWWEGGSLPPPRIPIPLLALFGPSSGWPNLLGKSFSMTSPWLSRTNRNEFPWPYRHYIFP